MVKTPRTQIQVVDANKAAVDVDMLLALWNDDKQLEMHDTLGTRDGVKNFRLAGTSQVKRQSAEDIEFFLCISFADLSLQSRDFGKTHMARLQASGLVSPHIPPQCLPTQQKHLWWMDIFGQENPKEETLFLCGSLRSCRMGSQ